MDYFCDKNPSCRTFNNRRVTLTQNVKPTFGQNLGDALQEQIHRRDFFFSGQVQRRGRGGGDGDGAQAV